MTEPTNHIGRYKIVYQNGITQYKFLISHSDYEEMKLIKDQIFLHEESGVKERQEIARELKSQLKIKFGDSWFTDQSPIYLASQTGILSLPKTQGGDTKCSVTLHNNG